MTNTEGVKPVRAIQADRDAAAPIIIVPQNAKKIRDGEMDWNPVVQAFARHRIAHQPVEVDWEARYMEAQARVVERDQTIHRLTHQPDTAAQPELEVYDAGLLSDYGGGNVGWWQDYIRAELERAHEFYASQVAHPPAQPVGVASQDIRIAIWNAGMNGGMGQELTQAFIARAMEEPMMRRALAALQHPDPQAQGDVVELLENAEGAAQWLDQMADRFEGEWPNTAKHCRIHVNSLRHAIAALSQHPGPQPQADVVRVASRAIHEHLCKRDIMQYLDNDEDCEGLARAVLAALSVQPGEK